MLPRSGRAGLKRDGGPEWDRVGEAVGEGLLLCCGGSVHRDSHRGDNTERPEEIKTSSHVSLLHLAGRRPRVLVAPPPVAGCWEQERGGRLAGGRPTMGCHPAGAAENWGRDGQRGQEAGAQLLLPQRPLLPVPQPGRRVSARLFPPGQSGEPGECAGTPGGAFRDDSQATLEKPQHSCLCQVRVCHPLSGVA